jgi:hypothetical protein
LLADKAGLTLFYGIFVVEGTYSRRMIAHECRHVQQYEERGSIQAFLQEYLPQILTVGYDDSPLEKDAENTARQYELELTAS